MSTEQFYTAKQLAGLPGIPGTEQAINRMAKRENWPHRNREGRGGGREYAESALPTVTRAYFAKTRETTEIRKTVQDVILAHGIQLPETKIRDWQRETRDARTGLVNAIKSGMQKTGGTVGFVYVSLIMAAYDAGEHSHEYKMLTQAKDARGLKSGTDKGRFPSIRTVQRWLAAEDLAPKARQQDLVLPLWADDFLHAYRQPQKPSVDQAYSEFCKHYVNADRPSIHQVRRLLEKLPAIVREKGRMGAREIKNIKPFVRRTFEELWPNDVWSADGHTFDAEVQHPLHGRNFRPEITSMIDIGTRVLTGFSVGLAESSLATVDALRHGITCFGVPAVFYVDNGSGYANELLENAATGLLARCGITVKHSLPYNSQARGVIERLHRSVWIPAAKTLPSYIGADMDREAKQLNFKLTRTGDKEGVVHLPISWPAFIRLCEDAIAAYNQRPHSSLPKFSDENGKRRHYSPLEYWQHKTATIEGYQAATVSTEEAEMLFKPQVERKVLRGEINLFGNKYFAQSLDVMHDETVHVAYDIHDADHVWIYAETGEFICKAEWNGNAAKYQPTSVIEMARDKRADGRLKRAEVSIDEILAERNGGNVLEAIPVNELPGMEITAKKVEAKVSTGMAVTIPEDDRSRHLFWREWNQKSADGTAIPESLQMFLTSYPKTAKYRSWEAYFNAGSVSSDSATG
jgi:putative transposase